MNAIQIVWAERKTVYSSLHLKHGW